MEKNPGVYIFSDVNNKVIYVGKAINLANRVRSYFSQNVSEKTKVLIDQIHHLNRILVNSEVEALLLEAELIKNYRPRFNILLKDDKSYLYIKITTGNPVPVVCLARREKPKKGVRLFGPFPSSSTVRYVLKMARSIFPYCSCKKQPRKPCLYCHLGLCANPYFKENTQSGYKNMINNLALFLTGHKKQLLTILRKKMQQLSKEENFEEAAKIRDQIEKIKYITQSIRKPSEYMLQPNLLEDLKNQSLDQLKKQLNLPTSPSRIEGYDISNIQGKFATGSMVVLTDGNINKSQYRHFKIKLDQKPNDVGMMREILQRRFKNNWPKPDLIIVDGGLGQLNVALQVIAKFKLKIPAVGLAKRLEEIYLSDGQKIKLPRSSGALQILQTLRDEAHRFAISYHQKLRKKSLML